MEIIHILNGPLIIIAGVVLFLQLPVPLGGVLKVRC
jgi:hypothetical protein